MSLAFLAGLNLGSITVQLVLRRFEPEHVLAAAGFHQASMRMQNAVLTGARFGEDSTFFRRIKIKGAQTKNLAKFLNQLKTHAQDIHNQCSNSPQNKRVRISLVV
ncbi:MAG: hypothetical protein AAB214_20015 [Fibrobacterota bacterium]